MSLLRRTLILLGQGPTLLTSFNLNDFLKGPPPCMVALGVRASAEEYGGIHSVQSTYTLEINDKRFVVKCVKTEIKDYIDNIFLSFGMSSIFQVEKQKEDKPTEEKS